MLMGNVCISECFWPLEKYVLAVVRSMEQVERGAENASYSSSLKSFKTGAKNRLKLPLLPISFHHLSAPLPWGEAKADSSRVKEQGCGWGTFLFFSAKLSY